MPITSEPAPGSVKAIAARQPSVEESRVSQRCFCSSVPERSSGRTGNIVAPIGAESPAQPHESSSAIRLEVTADTPPPPYSTGIACDVSPSAAALPSNSAGQSSLSSHSRAIGRSSRSAKSWARSRSSRCSPVSSNEMPAPVTSAERTQRLLGRRRGRARDPPVGRRRERRALPPARARGRGFGRKPARADASSSVSVVTPTPTSPPRIRKVAATPSCSSWSSSSSPSAPAAASSAAARASSSGPSTLRS